MKLTPLDIHHKEFRHSLRGYNEEEVDQFLDQVADEFERLFKENVELNERIEALQNKVNEFELQRQTINNTLLNAQRSADDIISRAEGEAHGIVSHANLRAKEIVNDALAKKQQVRGELLRIKQAEEEFRERYRGLLESNLRSISEVGISDEVNQLLGETDETVDSVMAAGPAQAPRPAPEPMQAAVATPVEMPSFAPEPAQPVSVSDILAEEPAPAVAPEPPAPQSTGHSTQDLPPLDLPVPGFVQSVTLGEVDSPEIPPDVDLVEPSEFSLPGFAALGEREDDDIEEID
jgi:cell division initiation protein